MTPNQIKTRRLELGLTTAELANCLQITETELLKIESGESTVYTNKAFEEAFDHLEEVVFGTYAGA